MVQLMMILDLPRQGLSIAAIARRKGRDPKTVCKYIARGLELPAYGPRQPGRPSKLAPYLDHLREHIAAFPSSGHHHLRLDVLQDDVVQHRLSQQLLRLRVLVLQHLREQLQNPRQECLAAENQIRPATLGRKSSR